MNRLPEPRDKASDGGQQAGEPTMKAGWLAMALILNAMPKAFAEESRTLQLKSKAAIATVVPHRSAPYVQPLGEAQPEPLIPRSDPRHGESRSSCESDRTLCYDPNSGRVVYKPARQYMPELPGLKAENISVKRDRITFKYSF